MGVAWKGAALAAAWMAVFILTSASGEQFSGKERLHRITKRVVGGTDASDGGWPWYVFMNEYRHGIAEFFAQPRRRSGCLISNKWVVTTAQNILSQKVMLLALGLRVIPSKETELDVRVVLFKSDLIIVHEEFDTTKHGSYDIAVIKLGKRMKKHGGFFEEDTADPDLVFSSYIQPAYLPCVENGCMESFLKRNTVVEDRCRAEMDYLHKENSEVFLAGHGLQEEKSFLLPNSLQETNLKLLSDEECAREGAAFGENTHSLRLCANSEEQKSSCAGDAGAPVIRQLHDEDTGDSCYVLVGMVSSGFGCPHTEQRYGKPYNLPEYFTRVAAFSAWIQAKTGIGKHTYSCPELERPMDGSLMVSKGDASFRAKVGAKVSFKCSPGYNLVGPRTITCEENGSWSAKESKCVADKERVKRVVGGNDAPEKAWPWYVYMAKYQVTVREFFKQAQRSSGTLINRQWVLTSWQSVGHVKPQELLMAFGLRKTPKIGNDIEPHVLLFLADEFVYHEQYSDGELHHDAVLIKLGEKIALKKGYLVGDLFGGNIEFSDYIRPATLPCMPSSCMDRMHGHMLKKMTPKEKCEMENQYLHQEDSEVHVIGHGIHSQQGKTSSTPEILQQTVMKLRSEEECKREGDTFSESALSSMICANSEFKRSSCGGDAGAPVMRRVFDDSDDICWVVVGLVSIGSGCPKTVQRGDKMYNIPEYFTKISVITDWIKRVTYVDGYCQKINLAEHTLMTAEQGSVALTAQLGAAVSFACDPGYQKLGPESSTCDHHGVWSDPAPTCIIEKHCDILSPSDHLTVKQTQGSNWNSSHGMVYTIGSTLEFSCDKGFKGRGSTSISCLSDGTWTGSAPACFATSCKYDATKLEYGRKCNKRCTSDKACGDSFSWCLCDDHCGKTCYNPDLECPELTAFYNGVVIVGSRKVGHAARYFCNEGFRLSGPAERKCQSDGNWSGWGPECDRIYAA